MNRISDVADQRLIMVRLLLDHGRQDLEGKLAKIIDDSNQSFRMGDAVRLREQDDRALAMVLIGARKALLDLAMKGLIKRRAIAERDFARIVEGAAVKLFEPVIEPMALLLMGRMLQLGEQYFFAASIMAVGLQKRDKGAEGFI